MDALLSVAAWRIKKNQRLHDPINRDFSSVCSLSAFLLKIEKKFPIAVTIDFPDREIITVLVGHVVLAQILPVLESEIARVAHAVARPFYCQFAVVRPD